jgi:hypothetical protein
LSDLLTIIRNKQKDFKTKYAKIKDKRIYDVLINKDSLDNTEFECDHKVFSQTMKTNYIGNSLRKSHFSNFTQDSRNNEMNITSQNFSSRSSNFYKPDNEKQSVVNLRKEAEVSDSCEADMAGNKNLQKFGYHNNEEYDDNMNSDAKIDSNNFTQHEAFSFTNKNIKFSNENEEENLNMQNKEISLQGKYHIRNSVNTGNSSDKDARKSKKDETKNKIQVDIIEANNNYNSNINKYFNSINNDNNSQIRNNDNNHCNQMLINKTLSINNENNLKFKFHNFTQSIHDNSNSNRSVNSASIPITLNNTYQILRHSILHKFPQAQSRDLDDEDKAILNFMWQFIIYEADKIEKELSLVNRNKNVLKNLRNSLETLDDNLTGGENEYMYNHYGGLNPYPPMESNEYPISKYCHLLSYMDEIQYDSIFIKTKERKIFDKIRIFESIAENIDICLELITNNRDIFEIKEKLAIIKNHLDGYYKNFEEEIEARSLDGVSNPYNKFKLCNSTDFFISQKLSNIPTKIQIPHDGDRKTYPSHFEENGTRFDNHNHFRNEIQSNQTNAYNKFLSTYDVNSLHGNVCL